MINSGFTCKTMKNQHRRRASLATKTCACLFSAMIFSATAQDAADVEIQLPPGVVLPPGVTLPLRPTRSAAGTNKTTEAKSPEEKRLQELLKLKFTRTAPAILDALAGQFDEKKTASTNEVEGFKQRVIVGDWAEVGKFLRSLNGDATLPIAPLLSTNDHGKQVYRYLLKELPNAAKSCRLARFTAAGPASHDAAAGPRPGEQRRARACLQ